MRFPRATPLARRAADPERDEKFESGFLQRRVNFVPKRRSPICRSDTSTLVQGRLRPERRRHIKLSLLRVANSKAREILGWRLFYRSYRSGLA